MEQASASLLSGAGLGWPATVIGNWRVYQGARWVAGLLGLHPGTSVWGGCPGHLGLFPHSGPPLPLPLLTPSVVEAGRTWGSKAGSCFFNIPGTCQGRPSLEREAQGLSTWHPRFPCSQCTSFGVLFLWQPNPTAMLTLSSCITSTQVPQPPPIISDTCLPIQQLSTALVPTPIPNSQFSSQNLFQRLSFLCSQP